MKFIVATNNSGKLREIRAILSKLGVDAVSPDEAGLDIDVEETGSTFRENATLKARAACGISGMPSIADDSGLAVEALGGAPGVYSARYGGCLSDGERCGLLLHNMKNMEQRAAKFVCNIMCVFPDGRTVFAEGECDGEIAGAPRGSGGFGYDPIFVARGMERTMAELTENEKNEISHRGKALKMLYRELRRELWK